MVKNTHFALCSSAAVDNLSRTNHGSFLRVINYTANNSDFQYAIISFLMFI